MILNAPTTLHLPDAAATARLGAALAPLVLAGDALLLTGGLGAGKSTLARGLIRALTKPEEDVPSPTFTLVQFYEASPAIAHFDLYRLTSDQEVFEVGLDEALDAGAILVEWPERLVAAWGARPPPDRLAIDLTAGGQGRTVRLTPEGSWKGRVLEFA